MAARHSGDFRENGKFSPSRQTYANYIIQHMAASHGGNFGEYGEMANFRQVSKLTPST